MALSVVFDGTQLASGGAYRIDVTGPDWGSQAVADTLLTGMLRAEEFDQYAKEQNLTRTVVLPVQIRAASADLMVTLQQTLTASLAKASRYAPVTMTVIPDGSSHTSTFKVWGGSWQSTYDQVAVTTGVIEGTLALQCDWPVYGAAQNLGSSGAPLVTNTASPAAVTLTSSPVGDVPADVILFVKNRSASAIRSLTAASINGNTTWVMSRPATWPSLWTVGANGTGTGGGTTVTSNILSDTTTIFAVASFTTPTLPSDRLFRIMLRADSSVTGTAPPSTRIRVVTGSTEVVGEWRTQPDLNNSVYQSVLMDMGGFMVPVSEVGSLGAGSTTTTVFVECRGNENINDAMNFYEALFFPDTSTVVVETSDTGKTLAAASGIVQLEVDQVYDASGNAAGGVVTGWQLRVLGSTKVYVYTSQQYMANMVVGGTPQTGGYRPENVDVWATVTPRYIGLA